MNVSEYIDVRICGQVVGKNVVARLDAGTLRVLEVVRATGFVNDTSHLKRGHNRGVVTTFCPGYDGLDLATVVLEPHKPRHVHRTGRDTNYHGDARINGDGSTPLRRHATCMPWSA